MRALLQLRQRSDLVTHNKAFGKGAAAAASLMSPMWVNEVYLTSLSNTELRKQLRGWSHLPLQQLLAKALDMEPDFRGGQRQQYDQRAGGQNPNRKQCEKCRFWFDLSKGRKTCDKGGTCRAAPQSGTSSAANTRRAPTPRVQEAEIEV